MIMANSLKHNYRAILAYNPVTNKIGNCKFLDESYIFKRNRTTLAYLRVKKGTNQKEELVLGVSLLRNIYQLSHDKSGYVKEDMQTTQSINRSRFFYALAKKAEEMGIDQDW